MIASPTTRFQEGTAALLVTNPNTSPELARSYADTWRLSMTNPNRWNPLYIYVFSDSQSADAFAQYQGERQNQPLSSSDYSTLATRGVWSRTILCYTWSNNRASFDVPQRAPNDWWTRRSRS